MKALPVLVLVSLALASGCKTPDTCTTQAGYCKAGSAQLCTDGSNCRLVTSDGSLFRCNTCGDCAGAEQQLIAWCAGGTGGGGGDTDAGASSNGEPQICAAYLSCAAQLDPSQFPLLLTTYGPSGSCWQSTTAVAASCTNACAAALAQAKQNPLAPSACVNAVTVGDMSMPHVPPLPVADMALPQTTIAKAIGGNVTTPITVTAVVTGIVGTGTHSWYIQDLAGGTSSGVMVYCNHAATLTPPCPASVLVPSLHDQVQISGTLQQYYGQWELLPTAQTVLAGNVAPPIPPLVSDADAAFNSTNAGLRGMPVRLMGNSFTVDTITPSALYDTRCASDMSATALCAGCLPPTYGGFSARDTGGAEIFVSENFYATVPLTSSPECTAPVAANQIHDGTNGSVATHFTALAGILDVDPNGPSGATTIVLQPTAPTDYTIQ